MLVSTQNFIVTFLQRIWQLYRSWYIPGTTMTPAELLVGSFVLVLLVRFVRQFGSSLVNTSSGKEKE